MDLRLLRRNARRHGLVVRNDLVPHIMSSSSWHRAHEHGALVAVHRGVSRIVDIPQTPQQTILAAVITSGPGALAAGPSAAQVWGHDPDVADPSVALVHVIVPIRSRTPDHRGVTLHRPTDLDDLSVSTRSGIPTSNPLRAALDVAAWAPQSAQSVVEHFVVSGLVGLGSLRGVVDRHARQGRPGITELRRLLDAWTLGERPPDSVLETRMARLFSRYGLPEFEFQRPIGGLRPDFVRLEECVIVECDGWEFHGRTRAQFERDRERDAHFQSLGFVVFRFTWRQITRQPALVARRINDGLRVRCLQLGLPR
jgi:very-short-patch-repair endonuclease